MLSPQSWEQKPTNPLLIQDKDVLQPSVEVSYLVSDRAKALIKLAHKGLGCLSIPDLFHLGHDLAKGYSLSLFSRLRQAKRELEQAKQRLETLQKKSQADPIHIAQAQAGIATAPPRLITGRKSATPGGNMCPICRVSCIPGGFRTQDARVRRTLRSNCKPN